MIQELQTGILDINNKYTVDFNCKQLDDIILKIIVYDKSLPADLSDYNCRLKAFKADQVPLIQNTNITIKENIIEIKASKQLTTTAGAVKAELQFINKNTLEKKSTFYINIEVVASVLDVDGVVSTPTCTILEEIDNKLDQIEDIKLDVLEAIKVKNDLNTSRTDANNMNNTLKTTTTNADNKKKEVETAINNASNKIKEVQDSTNAANTAKQAVDNSVISANSTKQALDTSKVNADNTKKEVDNSIKIADEKIEIIKQIDPENIVGDVKKLKEQVLENTYTKIETDSSLTKLESCKDSFVHNMLLRGKTLQNLVVNNSAKSIPYKNNTSDSNIYLNFNLPLNNLLIKPNSIYTFIIDVLDEDFPQNYSVAIGEFKSEPNCFQENYYLENIKKGRYIYKLTSKSDFSNVFTGIRNVITVPKNTTGLDTNKNIKLNIMLLEGEPKEIPSYFEGIKSVGEAEGNKISILTKSKNLCSLPDGFTANIESNKVSGTDYYRVGNIPTGTRLKAYLTYKGNLVDVNGEVAVNFADRNKKSLGFEAFWKHPLTPIVKPNTYYIKIFWNEKVGKEITFDNIIITVDDGAQSTPNLIYKEDKTEILIPSPHMGLPNGVSDIVDYDNNERTKNVGKVIFDGSNDENWVKSTSERPNHYIYVINSDVKLNSYCINDRFISDNELWNKDSQGITVGNGRFDFFINKTIDTLEKWKSNLQANPLTVYYQLANPVVEKLNIKDTLQTFENGYIQLDNAITPCTQLEYSTNLPSALGGLTKVVDHNVDEITNIESTISDMDAEIGEARKGKTTLEERLEDDRTNILSAIGNVNVETDGDISKQLKDINKNKAEGKVRLLNKDNISLLGLAFPCTCEQLAEAMKDGDILFMDSYILSDAPTNFGQLFVTRENSNRVSFQYRKVAESSNITENVMYIAYYRALSVTKFSGWKELATTETKELTLLNGWKFNYSSTSITKSGNSVIANLRIKDGNISNGTVLITGIPFKPVGGAFFPAYDRDGNPIGQVGLYENGELQITKAFTHNKDIVLNLAYTVI
ncbi:hypothetical protein FDB34_00800 [Clostridium botulinum]|nr:hypothetical protein [Clostridium botulinum]